MSTQQEKDNMARFVHEVFAEMPARVALRAAIESAELHGVPREHVVGIVNAVFGVVGSTPDAETEASTLAMIEDVYR